MRGALLVVFAYIFVAGACVAQVTAQPATRPVTRIGSFNEPEIAESSGLAASRKHAGVYWTHNDSGNPPDIFAVTREGKLLATYRLDVPNEDWEDIAIDDEGHLYIGDIGNNSGKRNTMLVYRVDEPDPSGGEAKAAEPRRLAVGETWRLKYPGASFDCESLFVYKGWGYVIPKTATGLHVPLYRFSLAPSKKALVLEQAGSVPLRSPVTAADITPDGQRLAILTYTGLNVFQVNGDLANLGKLTPAYIRLIHPAIEACCFVEDGVLVTAESREIFLFSGEAIEEGLKHGNP